MNIRAKLFLGSGNEGCFGPGCLCLLKKVHELGSLRQAALEMGMSYRWAWGRVQRAQQGLGLPLVARRERGTCGRAVVLTEQALALIDWFERSGEAIRQTLADAEAAIPDILKQSPGPGAGGKNEGAEAADGRGTQRGRPRRKR